MSDYMSLSSGDAFGSSWGTSIGAYSGGGGGAGTDYGSAFGMAGSGGGGGGGGYDADAIMAVQKAQALNQAQENNYNSVMQAMNMQQHQPQNQPIAQLQVQQQQGQQQAQGLMPPQASPAAAAQGGGGAGGAWNTPIVAPATYRAVQSQAQHAQPDPQYLHVLWAKRRDVARLVILTFVVLLAISSHATAYHYLKTYLEDHALDLTFWKELGIRAAYPVVILVILWHLKAFVPSK